MARDPLHQPRRECDRCDADRDAGSAKHQPSRRVEIAIALQHQQRKIECRMESNRTQQHQDPARDTGPITVMTVCAERGARSCDRKIGAGDDAERAVEWHGQYAAQRRQRPPHIRMQFEISEIFVRRKTKSRSRAVDHGVHRIGERSSRRRDRCNHQDLDALFRKRHGKDRMQGLREPGILWRRKQPDKRRAQGAKQRNAGGAEQKGRPHLERRARALAGRHHKPQYQQRRRNRRGPDHRWKGFKQVHLAADMPHF